MLFHMPSVYEVPITIKATITLEAAGENDAYDQVADSDMRVTNDTFSICVQDTEIGNPVVADYEM